MITVPQDVPHAAETLPINARTETISIFSKTNRSFSDDLHLSFDGRFRFQISSINIKLHVAEKCFDITDAFEDIPQVPFGASKRQEPPPAKPVCGRAPSSILPRTD